MTTPRIVTLLTDFGAGDTYVGQMKGAALAILPELQLVDLSHDVPAHDVAAGAYLLETAVDAFPEGTIHVAVVDPGVGTGRRAVAVETERHVFLAPDNGLLSRVLARDPAVRSHLVANPRYRRQDRSATFDGRDLFAPAAAWIARGVPLADLGPPAGGLVRLPDTRVPLATGRASPVRVLWVDRFGNVVLEVTLCELQAVLGADPDERSALVVETPQGLVASFRRTYADASGIGPFLLVNSAGHLEVALDRGRAADALGLLPGDVVRLTAGRVL